jgi:hypothetical protein
MDKIAGLEASFNTKLDAKFQEVLSHLPPQQGIHCNDPEKSPILELFVLFLFRVIVTYASSCIYNRACFVNLKLFETKSAFIFACMVL